MRSASSFAWWVNASMVMKSPESISTYGFSFLLKAQCHRVGVCGQMMIGPLGRLILLGGGRHLRCHQLNAAGGERRCAAGCGEARLQERPSLTIKRFLKFSVVQFKFRTRFVVTCAHRIAPRGLINMPPASVTLSSVRAVQQ
jgi:hypothetical protein